MDVCTIDIDSAAIKPPVPWLSQWGLLDVDKEALLSPTGWVTDRIIMAVQALLKREFPDLQPVTPGLACNFSVVRGEFLQIDNSMHESYTIYLVMHSISHWVTVFTLGLPHPRVAVYDSVYKTAPAPLTQQIASILCTAHSNIQLEYQNIQQQVHTIQ